MTSTPTINVPQWNGTPKEAGEAWTLRKGSRVASCHFWTQPKGGEARLTVDGEWHRGEALSDGLGLLETTLNWRDSFKERAGRDSATR